MAEDPVNVPRLPHRLLRFAVGIAAVVAFVVAVAALLRTDTSVIILAIVGIFTIVSAAATTWYNPTRIAIERQRSQALASFYESQLSIMREQLQRTEKYYDQRVAFSKEQVEVEKQKLEVERAKLAARNGSGKP